MSGAPRLPWRLLHTLGNAASLVSPPMRHMMGIVSLLKDETDTIWETHKAARRGGQAGQGVLSEVLRTYISVSDTADILTRNSWGQ